MTVITTAHPLAPSWRQAPRDPNALHAGVWPAHMTRNQHDMEVSGVGISELVESYGTPLYVMDQAELVARATKMKSVVESACDAHGTTGSVYYATKSFLSGHVISWLAQAGLGFDVATGGELAIALAGGAPASSLEFQGNNKSLEEIRQAISAGVGAIVMDAPIEADRINDVAQELGSCSSGDGSGEHGSPRRYS